MSVSEHSQEADPTRLNRAPVRDSSPQTAADANMDKPASYRSLDPVSPPAEERDSIPLPLSSAATAPRSVLRRSQSKSMAAVTTNSAPLAARSFPSPLQPHPAHRPLCTDIRPPPAALARWFCASGSPRARVFRAGSFPLTAPIPADSTPARPLLDPAPAA